MMAEQQGSSLQSDATSSDLWVERVAAPIRFRDKVIISVMVAAGVVSVLRLADWWFRSEHIAETLFYLILSFAFWYGISRIIISWLAYLAIKKPVEKQAPDGLRVAIFTTSSPGEPLSMFEKTLAACARIRYPHTTYLLDDTQDPRFKEVAEKYGAVWLGLVGLPGAKAGKINRALELTNEDFILVLDPDHVPFPNFLHGVLGYFDDEKVGYVQVSQAYYNQFRSFVARAAAEQTYAFYGPVMMGMYGHGCSLAIGANCTFRRKALESIGGHGIGLAEDMVTAIRLHAAGWKSVYVPKVMSRGLVPEDLGSFYKQQLKWSRGVFEILFKEIPRAFPKLTWQQRVSYLAIGTYYLCGLTTMVYLIIPYLYLWFGIQPASMHFEEFLSNVIPVGFFGVALYLFAQRWLCHPATEYGLHWRGLMLKVGCWPIYVFATVLALLGKEIPYIPTAKEAHTGKFLRLAWPHITVLTFYIGTVSYVVYSRLLTTPEAKLLLTSEAVWGMIAFATISLAMIAGAIYAAWESTYLVRGFAWDSVDLNHPTFA